MKIEKINDNQIKCTLTREDLEDRQLKLSELAYGTEKAKSLFRDLMLQAQAEYGFETNNMPLMIEAIPVPSDGIVLIVTKVEDPEELDSRFSKFAPHIEVDSEEDTPALPFSGNLPGADDILELFHKLYESKSGSSSAKKDTADDPATDSKEFKTTDSTSTNQKNKPVKLSRQFHFNTLDSVIAASKGLNGFYQGKNTLYKNKNQNYTLVLHQEGTPPEDFNKICNILSEYGTGKSSSSSREAYLQEHAEIILADQALQQLLLLA